jgi:hypothetical protein
MHLCSSFYRSQEYPFFVMTDIQVVFRYLAGILFPLKCNTVIWCLNLYGFSVIPYQLWIFFDENIKYGSYIIVPELPFLVNFGELYFTCW